MFNVAPTEFLLVAVVALLVIGPKDLPRVMREIGRWVARARGITRHFRAGLDTMVREAEFQEMEKHWAMGSDRATAELTRAERFAEPSAPITTSQVQASLPLVEAKPASEVP